MKQLLIAFILLSFSLTTTAQRLSYGVSTGALYSWKCLENRGQFATQKSILTIPVGVHLNYRINSNFAIETQLRYANEGHTMRYDYPSLVGEESAIYDLQMKHNYLRIPLNLHYTYSHEKLPFNIGIFAGPSLGIFVNNDFNATGVNQAGQELVNRTEFMDYETKNFDFGLNAGLRFSKNISNNTLLFLDIGYYKGLTDINKNPTNKINNNHLLANVGLLHRF